MRTRAFTLLCLAVAAAAGCGDDLGECDPEAARQPVYGRNGMVATKGQALAHDSCGNGVFCHSVGARGDQRFGAPAELDFDTLPDPSGWPLIVDRREAIWSAVETGAMPPGGAAARKTLGDGDWRFDIARDDDSERLPPLSSDEGKAALRNWLACGAPIVAETTVPNWVTPSGDGGSAFSDWSDIYTQVVRPNCSIAGCHNGPAAGGLIMTDECDAYDQLLAKGTCGGKPRLVKGDGDSFLLDKLESDMPECGGRMPPAGALPEPMLAAIRDWVLAGAPAMNCE